MNTKQGLVTAAWVLGSSMMLDAGQTAEAQQATNPAEYFSPQAAPQRTPAKSAPGLLPSALRSLNQSSNGDVARPIPTSTTPDAASKINGNKPASMIRPSSRSVQATMYQQPGVSVQPANQNNGTPSPVQQQLEELYRRDGRQMPPMTLQQAPNTQGPVGANQIQRPQTGNVAQAGKNTPAGVIAPKASNKPSFLSKLNPFKSRQAPATLPQHPTQPIPEPNGFVGRQPNGLPFMPSKPVVIPNPFNKAQPMQVPPAPIAPVAIAPAPPAQIESSTKDGATAIRSELSKSLPPVPGDPDYVATGSKNDATQTSAKPAGSVDEAIQNAFSDIAEEVVDGATSAPASEPKTAAEPNPFSGLSLDDDSSEAATPKATQPKTKLTLEANKAEDEISLETDKPLEMTRISTASHCRLSRKTLRTSRPIRKPKSPLRTSTPKSVSSKVVASCGASKASVRSLCETLAT